MKDEYFKIILNKLLDIENNAVSCEYTIKHLTNTGAAKLLDELIVQRFEISKDTLDISPLYRIIKDDIIIYDENEFHDIRENARSNIVLLSEFLEKFTDEELQKYILEYLT